MKGLARGAWGFFDLRGWAGKLAAERCLKERGSFRAKGKRRAPSEVGHAAAMGEHRVDGGAGKRCD